MLTHAVVCCRVLQVRIVRERLTGKIMAMKKLKKAEMLRRGQVGNTQRHTHTHTPMFSIIPPDDTHDDLPLYTCVW